MKNSWINVIIWGLVAPLWCALAAWRIVEARGAWVIALTLLTAVLSVVCFVLWLVRLLRERRAIRQQNAAEQPREE